MQKNLLLKRLNLLQIVIYLEEEKHNQSTAFNIEAITNLT